MGGHPGPPHPRAAPSSGLDRHRGSSTHVAAPLPRPAAPRFHARPNTNFGQSSGAGNPPIATSSAHRHGPDAAWEAEGQSWGRSGGFGQQEGRSSSRHGAENDYTASVGSSRHNCTNSWHTEHGQEQTYRHQQWHGTWQGHSHGQRRHGHKRQAEELGSGSRRRPPPPPPTAHVPSAGPSSPPWPLRRGGAADRDHPEEVSSASSIGNGHHWPSAMARSQLAPPSPGPAPASVLRFGPPAAVAPDSDMPLDLWNAGSTDAISASRFDAARGEPTQGGSGPAIDFDQFPHWQGLDGSALLQRLSGERLAYSQGVEPGEPGRRRGERVPVAVRARSARAVPVVGGSGGNPPAVPDVMALVARLLGGMSGGELPPIPGRAHPYRDWEDSGPSGAQRFFRQATRRALEGAGGQVLVALEATAVGAFEANFPPAMVIFLTQQEENQGVDQEVIESKTITVTMGDETQGGEGSGEATGLVAQHKCVVCLESFEAQEELRVLPCFHRYHRACIDAWLARNRHCPICKHDIME